MNLQLFKILQQIGELSVAVDRKIDREEVAIIELTIEVEDLNAVKGYSQVVEGQSS